MLSDEGVKDAITGTDVEQKVTDCLQDWSAAGGKAVTEMMEKQREAQNADAAKAQFIISLIGNLAWASTVFFPPAAAVVVTKDFFGPNSWSGLINTLESPGPSAATKIVSVLGAAVGSNTIGQLSQPAASLDWPAVGDYLDSLVPLIAENLASVAQDWTDGYLANHMIAMFGIRKKPDISHSNDKEFKEWVKSYEGGGELRKTVWEKFVFPVDGLTFNLGRRGLKEFLIRKLTDMKTKYDVQYKAYMIHTTQGYVGYMSRFGNSFNRMTFEEWKTRRSTSFHFVARVEGLPDAFLKAQDQRLRETEFRIASGSTMSGSRDERIPVPGAGLPSR
jgi:hypothetical protein